MKKILILISICTSILFTLYITSSPSENKLPTVGIIQFVEHPALDTARKGLIDTLKKQGYENGKNIQIIYESAQGTPALSSQIAQKFVGQKVDIIVAIGTTPAQAALQNIKQFKDVKKIPLVFLSITNPEESKLLQYDAYGKLTSPYACGISDFVEVVDHLTMFKKILPKLLNLGVIYNPGEANSTVIISSLKKNAPTFGMNLIEAPASKTSDVVIAAQNLVGKVDAIFIDNDNTALSAFEAISNICKKNKIPLFVSDIDLAESALASLGPDQRRIGEQGAQFVELLLTKQSLPEDLGVQYADKVDLYINNKFAKLLDITIPDEILKTACQVLE